MALYCARAITNGFTSATFTNTRDWEEQLQTFISTVIYRSQLGLGVTIAGLTLSRRFQAASHPNVANTIDEARRVFLVGYMIAAKIMFDNDMSLVWWKRTLEREYDCSDLAKLEKKFYNTVSWNVQIDEDKFLQCLNEAFTWYEKFVEEHTLPSSPLPSYQPPQERRSRLPASCLSLELAGEAQCLTDYWRLRRGGVAPALHGSRPTRTGRSQWDGSSLQSSCNAACLTCFQSSCGIVAYIERDQFNGRFNYESNEIQGSSDCDGFTMDRLSFPHSFLEAFHNLTE
jgi:hypothetical protein